MNCEWGGFVSFMRKCANRVLRDWRRITKELPLSQLSNLWTTVLLVRLVDFSDIVTRTRAQYSHIKVCTQMCHRKRNQPKISQECIEFWEFYETFGWIRLLLPSLSPLSVKMLCVVQTKLDPMKRILQHK